MSEPSTDPYEHIRAEARRDHIADVHAGRVPGIPEDSEAGRTLRRLFAGLPDRVAARVEAEQQQEHRDAGESEAA